MNTALSNHAVNVILKSLPLMERHRGQLGSAIGRYMARSAPYDPSARNTTAARGAIMDMLFDHAREIAGVPRLARLEETARRHGRLGVTAEDYSRFGDGFGVITKDVLGADATSELISAWGDAYWAIVRAMQRHDQMIAA